MAEKRRKRLLEEDRRKEEEFALDLFLEALGRPHGPPHRPESGQPDFVVDMEGEQVGIELTEVVWSGRREREELRFKVVGQAKEAYERLGGPPLEVRFLFSDEPVPRDKSIPRQILQLVQSMSPADLPLHVWHDVSLDQLEATLPFIASISVLRKQDGRTNLWTITDAGTVLAFSSDDVEQTIRRKEGALGALLDKAVNPLWLVIYTFDNRVSGSAELTANAAAASYRSRFNKVFVLNAPRKELFELNVSLLAPTEGSSNQP